MNNDKLTAALQKIAENEGALEIFVRSLIELEKELQARDVDVRETITGPILDSLFSDNSIIKKHLSDGTVFEFLYRSKIARDFVMSVPRVPDHAWEPQTTRLLLDIAKCSKNVIVGGAYFGDQAILLAKKILKNGGELHAFEPNDNQRRALLNNVKINNLENVKVCGDGLWNDSTSQLILVGYDSFAAPEKASTESKENFQTTTIDDYVSRLSLTDIDLIMLDIEGAELRALQGAEALLKKPIGKSPNIVFEVHRHYVDWTNGLRDTPIVKMLEKYGYQTFAIRDFNSNFDLKDNTIELIPSDEVYLEGPAHGFNMIAVKEIGIFQNDRYRFCSHVSPKLLLHRDPALHHPLFGL